MAEEQRIQAGDEREHAGLNWLLRQLPSAAVLLDTAGVALAWNVAAAELLGWSGPQALRRLVAPGTAWFDVLRARATDSGVGTMMLTRKRGQRRALELCARRLTAGDLLVLIRDVTPLVAARRQARWQARMVRRAEAALRASHERLRLITDAVRDHAAITVDHAGRIVNWNDGAERVTGFAGNDVIQQPFAEAMRAEASDADFSVLLRTAYTTGRAEAELSLARVDGSTYRAHVTVSPLLGPSGASGGYIIVLQDLTEAQRAAESLRRSEEQLRHSQKMDAIGRLASGIAHDFNNLLTALYGHVQIILDELPVDAGIREDAEEIRRAAERAAALTRQLLTFARHQVVQPVAIDLNTVIRDLGRLLRRLIREDIRLEMQLERQLPPIIADVGQVEQVLMNLIVNARDAIHDEAGAITIRTSAVQFDASYAARGVQLAAGDYVQLTVSDTGSGMSPEVQRHVFEPFFTTKRDGTGLGLSTVYGIVTQNGGHISVYSEEHVGTTFKVFFPVHTEAAAAAAAAESEQTAAAAEVTAGTVLLVEDDDAVRGLARRSLQSSGYSVVEARDGEDALRILREPNDTAFDVVVTDVNMPRLSGAELAARVHDLFPRMGIVMMSGFPEGETAAGKAPRRRYLEKPFTPVSLVRAVREAMEE